MSRKFSRTIQQYNNAKCKFVNALSSLGCEVVDVSRFPGSKYKNLSYKIMVHPDSSLNLPKNKTLNITFRSDARIEDSKNIFVEISHMWPDNTVEDGWFSTCQADYLAYMNDLTGEVLFLDWPKMKIAVDEAEIGTTHDVLNTAEGCTTRVCFVTLEQADDFGLIRERCFVSAS